MYFGEVINSFKDLMHQRDKFTFSYSGLQDLDGEWWEKHADEINGHRFVAVGFSDYGGSEMDNLIYRKAKEIDKKGGAATYEEVWNGGRGYGNPYVMGGNAIIFGEIADQMCEGKDDFYKVYRPLGDLGDDDVLLKNEFIEKNIDYISKDKDIAPLSDDDRNFLYDWLNDNGRMQATDIDYSYEKMWDALEEFRGKPKDDPRQMELDLDENKEHDAQFKEGDVVADGKYEILIDHGMLRDVEGETHYYLVKDLADGGNKMLPASAIR